jgi:hypothetical protein
MSWRPDSTGCCPPDHPPGVAQVATLTLHETFRSPRSMQSRFPIVPTIGADITRLQLLGLSLGSD